MSSAMIPFKFFEGILLNRLQNRTAYEYPKPYGKNVSLNLRLLGLQNTEKLYYSKTLICQLFWNIKKLKDVVPSAWPS